MRFLLRRYRSGHFFRADDDWTLSPTKAFDFGDKERAVEKARELGEQDVDVVAIENDGTILFGRRVTEEELGLAVHRQTGLGIPEALPEAVAATERAASGSTVLVAEDLESDAKLLRMAFNRAGMTVPISFVRDGAEVIEYLKNECDVAKPDRRSLPAMLLLDLKMPKMDGFEVLEWVRAQVGLKRLVVIVLTASNLKMDVNRAYDLGANSYLVKPHDFNLLEGLARNLRQYWLDYNRHPDCSPAFS